MTEKNPQETVRFNKIPQAFDEPDDELEEFEDLGDVSVVEIDPAESYQWEEGWDIAGWDDEDADEDFVMKLKEELEKYKAADPSIIITENKEKK